MAKGWLQTRCEEIQTFVTPFCPAGVTFAFGEPAIAAHGSPPRVTWARPTDGRDDIEPLDGTETPDAVCLWRHRIEAHCWAAKGGEWDTDEAAAEQLARCILFALFEFSQAEMVLQGSWLTEAFTKAGRVVVIAFALTEIVLKPAATGDKIKPDTVAFQPAGTTSDGALSAGEG